MGLRWIKCPDCGTIVLKRRMRTLLIKGVYCQECMLKWTREDDSNE